MWEDKIRELFFTALADLSGFVGIVVVMWMAFTMIFSK